VGEVEIVSEAGGTLRVLVPWERGGTIRTRKGVAPLGSSSVEIQTSKGEVIVLSPGTK